MNRYYLLEAVKMFMKIKANEIQCQLQNEAGKTLEKLVFYLFLCSFTLDCLVQLF